MTVILIERSRITTNLRKKHLNRARDKFFHPKTASVDQEIYNRMIFEKTVISKNVTIIQRGSLTHITHLSSLTCTWTIVWIMIFWNWFWFVISLFLFPLSSHFNFFFVRSFVFVLSTDRVFSPLFLFFYDFFYNFKSLMSKLRDFRKFQLFLSPSRYRIFFIDIFFFD